MMNSSKLIIDSRPKSKQEKPVFFLKPTSGILVRFLWSTTSCNVMQEHHSTLSQLSSLDLSSLLTFLDRFELVKPWERHPEHNNGEGQLLAAACWDLKHANPFEVAFFTKSKERLKKILASVGLQWHAVHHDKHIFLYRVEGGKREEKPLIHQEVGALVTAVEEELEKEGKFDYISFVNQNLKAGIELIPQLRPYAKDLVDEKVTPQPIEPCEVVPSPPSPNTVRANLLLTLSTSFFLGWIWNGTI